MPLPSYSFTGADFFVRVRERMNGDRAMFGGSHNLLEFAVMDHLFYRMEVFQRPIDRTFTDAAQDLHRSEPDVRVIINANFFGRNRQQYVTEGCMTRPCRMPWNSEIIVSGTVIGGEQGTIPDRDYFFIGRENAIPYWRYHVGQGIPSSYHPSLSHAMGALLPLIHNRIPYREENVCSPDGDPTQIYSPGTASALEFPRFYGKPIVGLHRSTGSLFALCQRHGEEAGQGEYLQALINLLQEMGVEDALLGDSGNSATFLVDGIIHAEPASHKNNSIPSGIMFRHVPLQFGAGATFTVERGTGHLFNMWPEGTTFQPLEGMIEAIRPGLRLTVYSFGETESCSPEVVAEAMELIVGAFPFIAYTSDTELINGVTFEGLIPVPDVELSLSLFLTQLPGDIDGLEGTLTITENRSTITGTLEIPI